MSRACFDRMFQESFRPLLGYALRRVQEPADAADVVAETFLVAREVLALACWDGLEPGEVAIVLEVPPATARTRLHRARGRLRAELAELGRVEIAPGPPRPVAAEEAR